MLNRVILMGRLTKDPEFRQTSAGASVCRFSVAVSRVYTNRQSGEKTEDTTFVDCTAWRQTADFVSRWFHKGQMILVEGELRNNNYTDSNGVKHYSMNVNADSVSFCGDRQQNEQQNPQQPYPAQNPQQAYPPQNPQPYPPQNQPGYAQPPLW